MGELLRLEIIELLREHKIVCIHRGAAEDAEKSFLVCREIPTNQNLPAALERFLAEGQRLMENRHLPILHKEYSAQ